MINISIFASGSGSNAQRIAEYFGQSSVARVRLILSDHADAFVLERAARLNIPCGSFSREELGPGGRVSALLRQHDTGFIVLAGFLRLIPGWMLQAYPQRIVNIHPALLPGYGGKGMYGMRVHEAVIAAGEPESGITIHYVNERYDEGAILFQARCPVMPDDTPETLATRIHALEHEHFPRVIEETVRKLI